MYKCHITKTVLESDDNSRIHEVLTRNLELPFPPYPGLAVRDGKFYSGELTAVVWDVKDKIFFASTKNEFPWENEDRHIHTPEEITTHLVKHIGWVVTGYE